MSDYDKIIKTNEINEQQKNGSWGPFIFVVILVILILSSCVRSCNNSYEQAVIEKEAYKSRHVIAAETFNGTWPFTVKQVQVHNILLDKELELTGAKIIIDGEKYALTKNLATYPKLPLKYWKNGKTTQVEGYGKVCEDVMLDKNTCKASLADVIEYINKLEPEKENAF